MQESDREESELDSASKNWTIVFAVLALVALAIVSVREDQPTLFVGVLTVAVTAYGISRQQDGERQARIDLERREREARRDEDRRSHKVDVYTEILSMWFDLLLGDEKTKKKRNDELPKMMRSQVPKVVAWGSDEVVHAFSRLRTPEQSGISPLAAFAELLLAIRADLGHHNDGVERFTLLSLFVNDLTPEKLIDLTTKNVEI